MPTGFRFENCKPENSGPFLGWVCSYTPEELIIAAGLTPYRLRPEGNFLSEAEAYLPANLCPYVRSLLGCASSGRLARLEAVVFVLSCDAMRRLADIWQLYLGETFCHRLEVPRRHDAAAEDFFAAQLQELRSVLEHQLRCRITDEDMSRAILTLNRTRRLIADLARVRLLPSPSISAAEFYAILHCGSQADKQRFNAELQRFLDSVGNHDLKASPRPRVLVCGCVLESIALPSLVEECGLAVVSDDLCTGLRHYGGLVDTSLPPLRALARRYLQRLPCARMTGSALRHQRLLELVHQAGVQGVIFHTLKFCDLVQAELPGLRRLLERQSIPLLYLECDNMAAASGQLKTRIQAFAELLGDRGQGRRQWALS